MNHRVLTLLMLACCLGSAPSGSMEQDTAAAGVSLTVLQVSHRWLCGGLAVRPINAGADVDDAPVVGPCSPSIGPLRLPVQTIAAQFIGSRSLQTSPRLTYHANAPPRAT